MLQWLFSSSLGAAFYRAITANRFWSASLYEALDQLGPIDTSARVLDVGCGPGNSTRVIADRLGDTAQIVGVDLSDAMLRIASRAPASPAIHYVHADISRLPFADNSFDLVVGNSVLYLCDSATTVLTELSRVLRPGGRVIFVEPARSGRIWSALPAARTHLRDILAHPIDAALFAYAITRWRLLGYLLTFPDPATLTRWFASAGLQPQAIRVGLGGLTCCVTGRYITESAENPILAPQAARKLAANVAQR